MDYVPYISAAGGAGGLAYLSYSMNLGGDQAMYFTIGAAAIGAFLGYYGGQMIVDLKPKAT